MNVAAKIDRSGLQSLEPGDAVAVIEPVEFHKKSGLLASGPFLKDPLLALVEPHIRVAEQAH